MARKCIVCGRTIRSGRKYCYEHRNHHGEDAIEKSMIDRYSREFFKGRSERGKSAGVLLFMWIIAAIMVSGDSPAVALIMFILGLIGGIFLVRWLIKKKKSENEDLEKYLKHKIRKQRDHNRWKEKIISEA